MDRDRIGTGRDGEALAAAYLKKHGLEIVERNLRCPLGEVDLIARDGRPTSLWKSDPSEAIAGGRRKNPWALKRGSAWFGWPCGI